MHIIFSLINFFIVFTGFNILLADKFNVSIDVTRRKSAGMFPFIVRLNFFSIRKMQVQTVGKWDFFAMGIQTDNQL